MASQPCRFITSRSYRMIPKAISSVYLWCTGMLFGILMLLSMTAHAVEGGVTYRVGWDAAAARYRVYARPTTTPQPDLSLTGQVTLRVPHGNNVQAFKVTDIQSKTGTQWSVGSVVTAPKENPSFAYVSFVFSPLNAKALAFQANVEQELFSFKNSGACLGEVQLLDNINDPFSLTPTRSKNSAGTNPNNQFANVGWGSSDDNDYLGNYGAAANCQTTCATVPSAAQPNSVYYRIAWQASDQRYHVYMYPGSVPSRNMSLTSQVTLKVPHSSNGQSLVIQDLQSALAGASWAQTSRVDTPQEDPTSDYLSFTMTPTDAKAFTWQAGKALEVFSFAHTGSCPSAVTLMENTDPFNRLPNSVGTNPGNQFTNLGWGDAGSNNYAGNYGCAAVCVDVNRDSDNDGLSDEEEAKWGTDPNNPDSDTDTIKDGEEVRRGMNPLKADAIRLQARVMLQGAYDSKTKQMRDSLRVKGVLPAQSPYPAPAVKLPEAGSTTLTKEVLALSNNDAVVDWVIVELRDANTPGLIRARLTGVVQRDGDIVDAASGAGTLLLLGVEAGRYFIAIKHRNHLGAMTAAPLTLSAVPAMVDFSQKSMLTYGENAQVHQADTLLLWAGNTNADAYLIAQGPANDSGKILSSVLTTPANSQYTTNYKLEGYLATDTNMDGVGLFAGPSNDLDLLLGNVLLHPVNTTFSANYIIRQQLP